MAEIEHYVDPKDKSHPRFVDTKEVQLQLLPKDVQERGETTMTHMTVGDAVGQVCGAVCCRSSSGLIFILLENRRQRDFGILLGSSTTVLGEDRYRPQEIAMPTAHG
jgi:hypothetical protein